MVQTERPGRQASALTSSGQVAMYRNSLVFLPGVLQQLVVWLWRWSGILVGVFFAGVVRQYGAVSRQVLITFFECVVQYRAQGPVGRVFILCH